VNSEVETLQWGEVLGKCGVLARIFPGNDEEKHTKPESVWATCGSSFKPKNALMPKSGATKYEQSIMFLLLKIVL
jgi:hypothetical protein